MNSRTWEECGEMLDECLLCDGLACGVHGRDGQAQDVPQRDKLGLTDRRHADWRHITCRTKEKRLVGLSGMFA